VVCIISLVLVAAFNPSTAAAAKAEKKAKAEKVDPEHAWAGAINAKFDINKMSDMSDFNPETWVSPTGDTIKIAFVDCFSGPGSINGYMHYYPTMFAVYDINKRGGLWVDGKKKLVELIKADSMSKPDQTRKICERMVLQEKVHVLLGTTGSNIMKIVNQVADKYKIISVCAYSSNDDLQDAANFTRYSFLASISTQQVGRSLAYYYGQIRKKEKKFYVLCQDYSFGHNIADSFKDGLKEYYPGAVLVGEDYHKLFLTDYAPYLQKIKASGAEAIFTGDWPPDSSNLLKQAREMGVKVPLAGLYMNFQNDLNAVGVEGSNNLVNVDFHDVFPAFKYPGYDKFYKQWRNAWLKCKNQPFNSKLFENGNMIVGAYTLAPYWLLSVIERAKSIDPEKMIKIWEGDTYQYANGRVVKMRACDHKEIMNVTVNDFVPPERQRVSMNIPPHYWSKEGCAPGPGYTVPAGKVLPWMDPALERCKGKGGWGE
jgi:ABC-type branched-subunit amino acid transport system substrate-binding protein